MMVARYSSKRWQAWRRGYWIMYLRRRGLYERSHRPLMLALAIVAFANSAAAAIAPTAIWHVRPTGNNANGGGFDPTIAGGTDWSKQDAAHVAFNGGTITATATGSTAVLLVSPTGSSPYTVATTDAGNMLHITGGTNFTVGWYEIVTVTTGAVGTQSWTLDRNPATAAASAMTGNMGGGWAGPFDPATWGNTVVAGNTIYILGSGVPNPPSYPTIDYFLVTQFSAFGGDFVNGAITIAGDPQTPNFGNTPAGRPTIAVSRAGNQFLATGQTVLQDLWFLSDTGGPTNPTLGVFASQAAYVLMRGVIYDQAGIDMGLLGGTGAGAAAFTLVGCEMFSSVATPTGVQPIITASSAPSPIIVANSNIHNTWGPGLSLQTKDSVVNTIISHVHGDGIFIQNSATDIPPSFISGNTIDANTGNGINLNDGASLGGTTFINNIITNHASGFFGVKTSGTLAANNRIKTMFDYNVYFGNANDLSLVGYGPHDTCTNTSPNTGCTNTNTLSPYTAQSTQNYTLH